MKNQSCFLTKLVAKYPLLIRNYWFKDNVVIDTKKTYFHILTQIFK